MCVSAHEKSKRCFETKTSQNGHNMCSAHHTAKEALEIIDGNVTSNKRCEKEFTNAHSKSNSSRIST